ncbi:MFS transporter [Streptomyces boncukensis]|uniref:MFS transporter n=1 Tax=Streptomyces boncukensis TaxID=2711219 RepID=A0A6G4X9H0_9ACTN|nr:MFS transporter [Streptomyces boncukensis]NGO73487.1 MFS transporter [Streptomyces boncukensis]
MLALIALCTAVTVANIYLAAPLLGLIADSFGTAASGVGWIAAVGQLGYAAGLLLFAPLGDTAHRRKAVAALALGVGGTMAAASAAPGAALLGVGVFAASAASVVPQLLVPLVAGRAPAGRRGRHIGVLMAGLFTGVVAARVLGGAAAQAYGWRVVFLATGLLTAAVGVLTAAALPAEPGRAGHAATANPLHGVLRTGRALAGSAELRRACLRQGGLFGAWSALWTSLVLLLTGEPYHLTTGAAGLFGLFGLAASVVAPLSGSLVDRLGARRVVRGTYALAVLWLPLWWLGGHQLWALCAAAVLVHAGLVAGQVANQSRALAATATPAAANTGYVVAAFAGGAAASALSGVAFGHWGWTGVCAVAACALVLGGLPGARSRG